MQKRKSKKIGNIYGNFVLVDTQRENGETTWYVKCLKCGAVQRKNRHSVEKCVAECDGCGKPVKMRNSQGRHKERIYHIYTTMLQRTGNKNKQGYNRYGGRGIRVCDEWENDFMSFYDWSMKNGYSDEKTIDRIDNDGDYNPENCRWVDGITQANNRRTNRRYTINGETKTVAEWAKVFNLDKYLVYGRLRNGWDIQRSLTKPVDKSKWTKKRIKKSEMENGNEIRN